MAPLTKLQKLKRDLGFATRTKMDEFLQSFYFKLFFDHYKATVIDPETEEAASAGQKRSRGFSLPKVQECMILGRNDDKWSGLESSETKDFSRLEQTAFTLYRLIERNLKVGGVLHGRNMTPNEQCSLIWRLLKKIESDYSPARQNRKAKSSEQTVTEAALSQQPETVIENDRIILPANNKYTDEAQDITFEVDPVEKHFPRKSNAATVEEGDGDEDDTDPDEAPLSNVVQLLLNSASKKIDLEADLWKIIVISISVKNFGNPIAFSQALGLAKSIDKYADAEAITWMEHAAQEHLEKQQIKVPDFDDAAQAKYDEMHSRLDNIELQCDDIAQACRELNIHVDSEQDTIYEIEGMVHGQSLRFWQVPAVARIMRIYEDRNLRACVLADGVGLGKTYTAIAVMLEMIRRKKLMANSERKPFLVVVPPAVLSQWISEVKEITGKKVFRIIRYYGDYRRTTSYPDEVQFQQLLTKNLPILSEVNDKTLLIVTTYQTFRDRHGMKAFRKAAKIDSKTTPSHQIDQQYAAWSGNLAGVFETVILDEGQELKDETSDNSQAIQSLKAQFHLILTATPIPNGASDWRGYVNFVRPAAVKDEWWEPESLNKWVNKDNVDLKNFDPFEDVTDRNPAALLRYTMRAAQEFIFKGNVWSETKGINLLKIWRTCMIRRTNQSRIPFLSSNLIGNELPRVYGVHLQCQFAQDVMGKDELDMYDQETRIARDDLGTNKKGNQITWSLKLQRQLILMSTCTNLRRIDETFDLRAENFKKILREEKFWLNWLTAICNDSKVNFDKHPELALRELLVGAPKLRAFLTILKTQLLRDGHKILVFVQMPASGLYVYALLKILKIDVAFINPSTTHQDRDQYIHKFNDIDDSGKVLIVTGAAGGTGLNLQKRCFHVHILETPFNESMKVQQIGRVRRYGCRSGVVYVYEYSVQGAFDGEQAQRAIRKAIPEAMTQLNASLVNSRESVKDLKIGQWVLFRDQLRRAQDVRDNETYKKFPRLLTTNQFLEALIREGRGQIIDVAL